MERDYVHHLAKRFALTTQFRKWSQLTLPCTRVDTQISTSSSIVFIFFTPTSALKDYKLSKADLQFRHSPNGVRIPPIIVA